MADDLGEALTGVYSILGGQAQLFERGLTVVTGSEARTVVYFAFPMIGRPSIITGGATPLTVLDAHAVTFRVPTAQLDGTSDRVRSALAGRVCLLPTAGATEQVPLATGALQVLVPEERGPGGIVVPGTYGLTFTGQGFRERQLHDLALIGEGGRPRAVAPHAVYYRGSWTDFGIAHVTDMHVARRIDSFRKILKDAGRGEASDLLYNWNDRFRGFVKYANYLHGIGVLDVIVATGDLYDYMFENDDDPAGGGNAEFLRKLILGQAPGPQFADVEELRVPIFMVPGNHDYRKHPYSLIFDLNTRILDVPKDLYRIDNYSIYRLPKTDATILGNVLDGRSGTEVPNLRPEQAAPMVALDREIAPYRRFLAAPESYVVRLGAHRIVMVDSGPDTGIVKDLINAARVKLGFGTEDEETFVGGSPNCTGISEQELEFVSAVLTEAPDEGLLIVGLHAPLFNLWQGEYPYFLRETQRPSHLDQTHAFLCRQEGKLFPEGSDLEQKFQKRFPRWFPDERDHRPPQFVKRGGNQDLLDFGVSRGKSEELMRRLAGVGSRRPADVVLAGHTHLNNECSVRATPTGEIVYFMDFYTRNPARYYPSRFTRKWERFTGTNPPSLKPVTETTYVDVVPGAPPHAIPWPLPYEVGVQNQLQVPPYLRPLSHASDPRAWWAEHRPLVMQTAALGPLKVMSEFAGFRVLSVKNGVSEKVHFVSTEKLEANKFRLDWEEAIRPEPPPPYLHVHRSLRHNTPDGAGAPCAIVFTTLGVSSVVYRDTNGRFHELQETPLAVGARDLTELADNAIRADGDPTAYIDTTQDHEVVLYRGKNGHVHSLYWAGGEVRRDELSATAGAPKAAPRARPVGFVQGDGTNVAIYRAEGGLLQSLAWTGTNAPTTEQLTGSVGSPPAAGDPAPFVNTGGTNIVAYRGPDGDIHSLHWTGIEEAVAHDNLSAIAGAPKAAGDPVAYYTAHDDMNQVIYRGANKHVHELWWVGVDAVRHRDLTLEAGDAPPAASDPVAWFSSGARTKHVVYRSGNGHLHDLSRGDGGTLVLVDLTLEAVAPPAADRPAGFSIEGPNSQHVVYRGTDGQIHEIRWAGGDPSPTTVVPDVRGSSPTVAAAAIQAAALVPRFTGVGASVIDQSPRAGAVVARGSIVSCSTGEAPRPTTVVPDVKEDSPAVASAAIRAAGLVPHITGNGTWVATQSPRAGAVVDRGSTVTCSTRSGPIP